MKENRISGFHCSKDVKRFFQKKMYFNSKLSTQHY